MNTKSALVLVMVSVTNVWAVAEAIPDAAEILHRFSTERSKSQSLILKGHAETKFRFISERWSGTCYQEFEIRFNENCYKSTKYIWGDINPANLDVKKEQADYSSGLWDGENKYSYVQTGPTSPGYLIISNPGSTLNDLKKIKISGKGYAGQIEGYHYGDMENLVSILLDPTVKLELKDKKYAVRGNPCYVFAADVKERGQYTLWIDPEYDYHIARIRVKRTNGDMANTLTRLGEGDYSDETFEVLSYQKINGMWYPENYFKKSEWKFRDKHTTEEQTITFDEIILDPDHEKLQSFIPNDIPEGTATKLTSRPPSEEFLWKDSQVVDDKGKVVLETLVHRTSQEKKKERLGERK